MREVVDSGIDWIGSIPAGWTVRKCKYLFDILKRIAGKEGFNVLSVTQSGLRIKDIESGSGQLADDYSGYQFVYPGDFVMNHMDLLTGWIDCSNLFGVTSPDYRVFRPKKTIATDSRFYKYLFQYCYSSKVFYNLGNGVADKGRWRLQTSAFKNFTTPHPPYEEQRRIADYLDERCGAIDDAKAIIESEIESLRRLRKATIFKAVTKGLDNDTPMKDSDFSWIKTIPADWSVVPLKSQCVFGKGIQYNKSELTETGYPILSYGQVHSKENSGTSFPNGLVRYARPEAARSYPRSIVGKGEFLFAATSEDAESLGNCIYIDEDVHVLAGTDTIIIKCFKNVVPKYLAYQFKTDCWRDQFRKDAVEVKVYHLSATKLSRTKVILPPLDQQRRIVEFLDERCAAIDSIIDARTRQLERLEDYRKALIYAYVTGKKEAPTS